MRYASFDNTAPAPQPVTGWFDHDYPVDAPARPANAAMLPLTEEQWADRMSTTWGVQDGALVPIEPTIVALPMAEPTLADAHAMLAGLQARVEHLSALLARLSEQG